MNITNVRVRKIETTNRVVALASITLDDCFVVHEIKILKSNDGNDLFIAMPSKRNTEGSYVDIAHPINSDTRSKIQDAILEAYKEIENSENN